MPKNRQVPSPTVSERIGFAMPHGNPCDAGIVRLGQSLRPATTFIALVVALAVSASAEQQAGPNPGNITPAGAHGVSQFTGAFTYSYPIVAPPGRRGIQPNLALVYNSQARNGWLGVGWGLGLASIQRSTKNGIPSYVDSQDTFIIQLEGATSQLVAIASGTDGVGAYTEYRAQIESQFYRTRFYAPSTWTVTGKDGRQYQFLGVGQNTTNSKYFYWGLSRVMDPLGNYLEVSYPSLSTATWSGAPGPDGEPTAIISTGAVVGFMPARISYTGKCTPGTCADITLSPRNEVKFSYEVRSDTMTSAKSGGIQVIATRLKSIKTMSNGQPVRTYQLRYSTSVPLERSMLTSIIQLGSDSSSVLSTMTFTYQSSAAYSVALSSAYQLPVDYKNAVLVDVNGDALPDLVQNYTGLGSGAWINTGSGWVSSATWVPPVVIMDAGGVDAGARFADLNGDGLMDLIKYGCSSSTSTWLNSGSGWNQITGQWAQPLRGGDYFYFFCDYDQGSSIQDVNGDGFPDIVQYLRFADMFPPQYRIGNWLNTGSDWSANISTWVPPSALSNVRIVFPQWHEETGSRFADVDGDGLVDTLIGADTSRFAYLNNGKGWSSQDRWEPPEAFITNPSDGVTHDTGLRFVDINGDGLPDLVQFNKDTGEYHCWLNTEHGWIQNDAFITPITSATIPTNFLQFADLNGDGMTDVIAYSTTSTSYQVYLGSVSTTDRLIRISNGLGGVTEVTYGFSPPPIQPGIDLPPVTVVQSVAVSDGMSGHAVMRTSYSYSGGRFDGSRPYREFLGFQQVRSTDPYGNYSVTEFLQDENAISGVNLFKGMVTAQAQYAATGSLLAQTTFTVSYSTPYPGVYFPFIARVDMHAGDKHSAVVYVYDSSGNVKQQLDYGDVDATGDERTIATSYSASTGPYLIGYPAVRQTFAGLGVSGALLARTSFYYDSTFTQNPSRGELTKTVNLLSGGDDPVQISSFDSYGNPIDTYDALYDATGGAQGNHVRLTYDTTFYQYAVSVQQAVGSSVSLPAQTFTYDSGTGQMLSQVDVNGSTTTYTYDVFGRLVKVVGPADQVTASSPTMTYQYIINTAPPHSIVSNVRVIHGSSLTLATYSFADGLGRKIETKTPGPAGTQIISDAVMFDALGRTATSYASLSRPSTPSYFAFSSTHPRVTMAYDGLGRLTRTTFPDGGVSTSAYQGWTVTETDANGHSRTYVKDAYGRIIEVEEHDGAIDYLTTYRYDLLGNVTGIVNALGQGTTIYYDTLSRKTGIDDPQMGEWQYEYDPNGNLVAQTDGKNRTTSMAYDPLSRLSLKVYPDSSTVLYTYDLGLYGKGKLSEVIDPVTTQQFTYDRMGNLLSRARTMGGSTFVSSMTYDALGRETGMTYPDGSAVSESYDAYLMSGVRDPSSSFAYATLTYSTVAPTRIGGVQYGNGMTAQYTYDSSMQRLMNLKALAAGSTVQNLDYQYDNVGHITQISDSVGPMSQTFSYDPLDRLVQASGPYGSKAYSYDAVGNLTANPDKAVASWGFRDTGGLTAVQGDVISANGRIGNGLSFNGDSLVSLDGSTISFTPAALTISLWARPRVLGTGYLVSRGGSYYFPQVQSNGTLTASLKLSSGLQVVSVSSAPLLNLWSYYVLTYDGTAIKVYVNGQLWKSQVASGAIESSTQAIILGGSLNGFIDELNVYPRALSPEEILRRFELYPRLSLNEPYTPDSVPGGMTAGVINTTYTFAFTAWDLNGSDIKYRIDWGTGSYQETGYVPSGTTVQSTHVWTSTGTYSIRLQAVQQSSVSAWSPNCNVLIVGTSIQAALGHSILVGGAGVAARTSTNEIADIEGQPATGRMASSQTGGYLGYQSTATAPGAWTPQYLGRLVLGGSDASPTPELSVSDLVTVQYSTAEADVRTIALNLLEHGATSFADANGNLQVSNGRWLYYDFENRPVRIVTQDATLLEFAYDFEGNRTRQAVTVVGQSSRTTTYVGGIYQTSGTDTVKYITASGLRVAMLDSSGSTTYFLPDQLGSTNLLVSNSLSQVRATRYMPFGGTYQSSGTVDSSFKFTGQRLDADSDLYYYGARYYDPILGRFLTPDTMVQNLYDPQSLNRYAYVRNNPVNMVDPDGHFFWAIVIGAAIGAGTSGAVYSAWAGEKWTWQNFGQAVQGGALAGGISAGVGTGMTSAFGQNAAFGVLGNMSGYAGTTMARGGQISEGGMAGAFVGGLVSGSMPGYQAVSGGWVRNAAAEISYGAFRGSIAGAVGGAISAASNGGDVGSGILAGVGSGALAGATVAGLQVGLLGSGYKASQSDAAKREKMLAGEGFGRYGPVLRNGGLYGLGLRMMGTPGIALGRNLIVMPSKDHNFTETLLEETWHYRQAVDQGYGEFLRRGVVEQVWMQRLQGIDVYNDDSSTQEYEASHKAKQFAR